MNVRSSWAAELDRLGSKRQSFFFLISFDKQECRFWPLDQLGDEVRFTIGESPVMGRALKLQKQPMDLAPYREKFSRIKQHIFDGDTYLLNLTAPTPIRLDMPLEELYDQATARFKVWLKERFVCFSPEPFVQMKNNTISTYPMKGTIPADVPDAERVILEDAKEMAEHVMVVDLLRNDLSMVASNVRVERFRYLEKIWAGEGALHQVSSHISGALEPNWQGRIGTILDTLLPAGSVSGAPKKSTCEIIQEVEGYERGFYTGIGGVFDGESLQSYVLIRYIEQVGSGLLYKSGGGIVWDSEVEKEYAELLRKVYVPVF